MDQFMSNNIPSGLLTVLPKYSQHFIPMELRVSLPQPMSTIFSSELKRKTIKSTPSWIWKKISSVCCFGGTVLSHWRTNSKAKQEGNMDQLSTWSCHCQFGDSNYFHEHWESCKNHCDEELLPGGTRLQQWSYQVFIIKKNSKSPSFINALCIYQMKTV